MTQENSEVVAPVNPYMGTTITRLKDFIRLNPLEFYGSKVEEDLQEFIDEGYKLLMLMRVTPVEKVELNHYKLKGIAEVLFNQWKEESVVNEGPLEREKVKVDFNFRFFPIENKETKVLEFIILNE